MRRKLIAGNWKMNGLHEEGLRLTEAIVERRLRAIEHGADQAGPCELLICPPFTLLAEIRPLLGGTGVFLGAQDCYPAASGAHTGDISAAMLADLGCEYVIVGHSERRQNHGETDSLVQAKARAALDAKLCPVICIGETESERETGKTQEILRRQLSGSLPDLEEGDAASLVVAYEPVWAIGTGRTAETEDVRQAHTTVREFLGEHLGTELAQSIRVLYGGSVKPENSATLLAVDEVDGALVGGASLKAEDFWAIATSCP